MVEYGSLVVTGDGRGEPPAPPTDPQCCRPIARLRPRGPHAVPAAHALRRHLPAGRRDPLHRLRLLADDRTPTTRTLELGGTVTSGEECYPQKITRGRLPAHDRRRSAATRSPSSCPRPTVPAASASTGTSSGARSTISATPTCRSSPSPPTTATRRSASTRRTSSAPPGAPCWLSDTLMKMLLRTRPYELEAGRGRPGLPRRACATSAGRCRAARRLAQASAWQRDGGGHDARRATGSAPCRRATTARAR